MAYPKLNAAGSPQCWRRIRDVSTDSNSFGPEVPARRSVPGSCLAALSGASSIVVPVPPTRDEDLNAFYPAWALESVVAMSERIFLWTMSGRLNAAGTS